MNNWLNYHHLFYFKTIAEEGSVSKAALKLRIGQPTLSAQLKLFEDVLEVQLFERQHRKLILTEQGQLALNYAKNIFKLGSEMYEVLHDRMQTQKPTLHIGALDSISKQIVLNMTKSALKISSCHITLSEGKSDELLRELMAHNIDLVLTNFLPTGANAKGLYPKLLAKNNVAFYASPKFKKLKNKFPESISTQPLIVPTYDSKLRLDIEHWAKLHKVELNIIIESQDVSVKKLLASHEFGLIPAAQHMVSEQLKNNELIEIGRLNGVYEELYLISAQRKIENSLAATLKNSFSI